MDIINKVVAGLRKVGDETAVHIARLKVSQVLKSTEPSQRNSTQEEAVKELRYDVNIVIFES